MNRKLHKWVKRDVSWHQVCERCGATRWGIPGGWGRSKDPLTHLPKRWCVREDDDQ